MKPFLYYALKQLIPLGKMDIRISGYEVLSFVHFVMFLIVFFIIFLLLIFSQIGRYEWFWLNLPSFKKHVRFLTALWGVGMSSFLPLSSSSLFSVLSTLYSLLPLSLYLTLAYRSASRIRGAAGDGAESDVHRQRGAVRQRLLRRPHCYPPRHLCLLWSPR